MSEKLVIVKTPEQLEELIEYVKDKEFIAFDTETTGVEKESQIIGLSLCADVELAYYVILSYWDPTTSRLIDLRTKENIKTLLEYLLDKALIMQNAVFDCAMVQNNYGTDLMPSVHTDTLILGHLLDENRSNGLKERGVELYGDDAAKEQKIMKESVLKNGGALSRDRYELYKADADLIAYYGAKDAILTLKLFYNDVPQLYEESLDRFFYEDESMPLLRGPTYDMNTEGLRVDPDALQRLKGTLEAECLEAKAFIYKEVTPLVKDKYPGTGKTNQFNIGSSKQLAWLLFFKMNLTFNNLTKSGKEVCKALGMKLPYTNQAKREFIQAVVENKGSLYNNSKGKAVKINDPWHYIACGKETLVKFAPKYKWVEKFLEYAKNTKLLNTYVMGIQSKMRYNVIRPSFLQHGTTSGRYSSRNPNFQNLPRDDKRIKSCIVVRPGNVFVGADYSQLEPRVFASMSQDATLMKCFEKGEDFYSVVGAPIFDKSACSLFKNDPNSFAKKYPELRDKAKVIALATAYGRTAFQQAGALGITTDEAQDLIDAYFRSYPKVELMMLESHEQAKKEGKVFNLFGRPRRMPEAMDIPKIYGPHTPHAELPYTARNLLNLSMNHRIQSTGATIMNRAAIAFWKRCKELGWSKVKIVMQVHDELIIEGPEELGEEIAKELKCAMENTSELPGVTLLAEPKIGKTLADLK
jgi:DNA polymerase-1